MNFRRIILITCLFLQVKLYSQSIFYKVADFFRSPMEFREPFRMTLFDAKLGVLYLPGNALSFDSTETALSGYEMSFKRVLTNLEVDLLKYNLPNLLFRQNFVDFQTGLGFKYSYSMYRQGLPSEWPQNPPGYDYRLYLSPRLIEGNINQSLLFQWSPRIYSYLQFNYGRAFISAYKTRQGPRYLSQEGYTYSIALGTKILAHAGKKLKEGYGIEIKYYFARFDDFPDPDNLSPITSLDLSSLAISLTFNGITGGNSTYGDVAKSLYQKGDFIAAKANFENFIQENPKHPRKFKAEWLIARSAAQIPYQEVNLAKQFIAAEDYSKAAQYLQSASQAGYPELADSINQNYAKITQWFITSMDSLLQNNLVDQAEQMLIKIRSLNLPDITGLCDQYWSEIYFHRGAIFTEYRNWEKAFYFFDQALKKNPAIRERVDPWTLKIAAGYIEDANLSVDQKNVTFALESLRKATAVRPEISSITKEPIETLEQGIAYLREQAALEKLKASIEATRSPAKPAGFTLQIGMTQEEIRNVLGEPFYRKSLDTVNNQRYELWVYQMDKTGDTYLYFRNQILSKIEKE
jgi:tetratricopeptide (TPR) repeat protein